MTEERNARIARTDLGFHDGYGSIRNSWVHLDYGGAVQGFGGFVLGGPVTDAWIYGILDALECPSWEKLPGQYCRVRVGGRGVVAIGHPLKDRWFYPLEAFDALRIGDE